MASKANFDESKVPAYDVPDLLKMAYGTPVPDAAAWPRRRAEILELFRRRVYGRCPQGATAGRVLREESGEALGGLAVRRQIRIALAEGQDAPAVDLLLYLPKPANKPVPAFLGLNFIGNHTVQADPAIWLPAGWVPNRKDIGITDHRPREADRGRAVEDWPVEMILSRGYGLATAFYSDLDPDDAAAAGERGIRHYYRTHFGAGDAEDSWGAIGAWAWGLSRAMDYLEASREIDSKRVAVIGHSRLGKTALWAGASDERFAMAISNNSGCGGAAFSRRKFGETVERINTSFPHWFCRNFRAFNRREEDCPVDQHMLLALMAPRPVYVASASEDQWADPKGEFLSALYAGPVYRLLGKDPLPVEEMPPVSTPVMGTVGYHLRPGKHAITEYDWRCYLDFADRGLKGSDST